MHKGYKVVYKKVYNKNIDKYEPEFIKNNFGEEELMRIDTFFKESIKKSSSLNMKMFWIIFGVGWALAIIVTLIILIATGVIYFSF